MIRTLAVNWAAIVVCSNNDGKTAAETASYEMVIGEVQGSCQFTLHASTKWNSVRKPHAFLPDTPGNLIRASKYFQMLLDPPGAGQSSLRLCKSILRCSWKHLQLWRCIHHAPSRIVKFGSSWDLCADLWETLWEAETTAQLCGILRQRPKPLRSSAGDLMPYYHSSGSDITTRHFVCYSHKIRYIIIWHTLFESLFIYTYGQSGCRWYSRIIGEAPGHSDWELRDAPLEGCWGETMEREGREPTINTSPRLSRDLKGIHEKVRFKFEERKNRVRSCDTTRRWWSHTIAWIHDIASETKKLGMRDCIFMAWQDKMQMRWCLSTPGTAGYILPITIPTSITPESQYTRNCSLMMHMDAVMERVWRCTWRPGSCEFEDTLGGCDRVSLGIHLETMIRRV